MRISLNDRYIKGNVAFDDYGDKARLSYIKTSGYIPLPLGAQYDLNGKKWRVVAVNTSNYNDFVVNVDLELING